MSPAGARAGEVPFGYAADEDGLTTTRLSIGVPGTERALLDHHQGKLLWYTGSLNSIVDNRLRRIGI